jgi:sugar phosphate isomerase/epimerase
MKTSIFTLPDGMTFMQAIDYACELGLDAIEPYPHAELAEPSPDAARRIAARAAEAGIGISCFSMSADLTQADNSAEVARLKRYAEVAAALGSPYLHHTLAPSLSLAHAGAFGALLERAVSGAREVFDHAMSLGVTCAYEDQGFVFNGVERFGAFYEALDRPAGVVADLGNSLFVGERPEKFVGRFAPRVVHVHIKDYIIKPAHAADPGAHWYHAADGSCLRGTVIGHGEVNFPSIFRMLASAGYDGYYSMEFDGLEPAMLANELGLANMRRFHAMAALPY